MMEDQSPNRFFQIDRYPQQVGAAGVLVRLLDGLGFRFYWATHGLEEADYRLAPEDGSNSLGWMVRHIWGLMNWVHFSMFGAGTSCPLSSRDQRDHALELIGMIRDHCAELPADRLAEIRIDGQPFWHIINGPVSDALTHVGQINYLRRLLGKPTAGANVFTGKPLPAD